MPVEIMRLADAPLKLLECPSCWAPFHPFLRGAVHRSKWSWRTLWLVTRPVATPPNATTSQPWDVFSSDFGVCQDTFVHRGAVTVLPAMVGAQYRFTLDFVGTDLAEYPDQHKSLHVVFRDDGLVGAYPNNRLLWHDPAFWKTTTEKPDFLSLSGEFRSEGKPLSV